MQLTENQNNIYIEEFPPIIEGIKTSRTATKERREYIKQIYMDLLERLQRVNNKKAIHNDFLNVDVYIIMRESYKKASLNAAAN